MTRENWLTILAALLLVVVLGVFGRHHVVPSPLKIIDDSALATTSESIAPDNLSAAVASATTSTGHATSSTIAPTPQRTVDGVPEDLALSLGNLRSALVNIICVSHSHTLRSISGSGVIIDPRGIILTNAHVAQMFLLQDTSKQSAVQCVVRAGNPARIAYTANLAYISSAWIAANPKTLVTAMPTGTGENDMALLAITDSATRDPLPASFPYVPLGDGTPTKGQQVAIGSYGAQQLTTAQLESALYTTLVFGSIQERYTFATNTVDLISLGGSAAAQEGSSGGGVVNENGQLVGLITTSTVQGSLFSRDLRATTVDHLRRSFVADTGRALDAYITSKSPSALVADFAPKVATLAATLRADITGGN